MTWWWVVTALSLLATVLNIRRRRACFGIWLATNIAWGARCAVLGLPEQAALHVVYAALAVHGWGAWADAPAPREPLGGGVLPDRPWPRD